MALLREAGIRDYSIHLDPETNHLFAILKRPADHGMDALPQHEVMKRWWAMMADIMDTNPDPRPWSRPSNPCSGWIERMDRPARHVAVIDIGKTNAKVVLHDLAERRDLAFRSTANAVRRDGPYPHYDLDRLFAFVVASLARWRRDIRWTPSRSRRTAPRSCWWTTTASPCR